MAIREGVIFKFQFDNGEIFDVPLEKILLYYREKEGEDFAESIEAYMGPHIVNTIIWLMKYVYKEMGWKVISKFAKKISTLLEEQEYDYEEGFQKITECKVILEETGKRIPSLEFICPRCDKILPYEKEIVLKVRDDDDYDFAYTCEDCFKEEDVLAPHNNPGRILKGKEKGKRKK